MTTPLTMRANGTVRVGRFIKIDPSDNNSVLEANANERCFGISGMGGREAPIPSATADPPEAAQSGDNIEIRTIGELCLLYVGSGGLTAGDRVKSDADGGGVKWLTNGTSPTGVMQNIGAIALETASAGEYCLVQVHIFSETINT